MKALPLALLAAIALFAQTSPRRAASATSAPKSAGASAPADKWPIIKLSVEGNHRYTADQVLAVAGLKIGQLAGKAEFDAARDRLVTSGYFEMVAYQFDPAPNQNGEIGTFQVSEVEPSYPVRFEALGIPTADLEGFLRAKDPLFSVKALPPTKPVVDRYVGWVQEFLASKGSTEKILARVDPDTKGELFIVFRPARALPVVAQVSFTGNKAVPLNLLTDSASGVTVGVPYTEDHFRELLNTGVRPLYEARGHLRVAFTNIRTEPAANGVQGLHVFVTVDEGPSYQLAKFEIDGPTPVRTEQLIKAADVPTGVEANFDRIADGLEKMRKTLVHAGFMEAAVTSDHSVDDAKKTVDVTVHVQPGPQYVMGKLTISGLDLDGEAEIRRIFGTKEGKPFNPDYPQQFLNSVREQGLFDNLGATKSDTKINAQDHTVDVTLTFGGAAPATKGGRGRGGRGRGF